MSACAPARLLEHNLGAYFHRAPRLAEALRRHGPEEVQWARSRSGAPTLSYRGRHLHSSIDPEAEARAVFESDAAREADLVVLFGVGAGHGLRVLRAVSDARILVYEPNRDLLCAALRELDLAGDRGLRPDAVVHDIASLRVQLPMLHVVGDRIAIAASPSHRRAFPEELARLAAEVASFADQARLCTNTYDQRMGLWIDNLLANLPVRTRCASALRLEDRFRGVPAVIVSAGPSLERNVRGLGALRGRALVLSTNTAYRALEAARVVPDLVVAIEALDVGLQFEGVGGLGDTRALLCGVASPGLFRLPFADAFVFDDGIPYYQRWLERHFPGAIADWNGGLCVAHAAFSAALAMGCDPIVLVGQDLAHTGGSVYARGTVFEEMKAMHAADRVSYTGVEAKREIDRRSRARFPGEPLFRPEERRVTLPGYHGGEVESTAPFAAFLRWFENAAAVYGEERMLINATEGGARIEGFRQAPLAEVIRGFGRTPGIAEALAEAASRPALDRAALTRGLHRAARRLERVAGAARAASAALGRGEGAGAVRRLRALCRAEPLLNGYLRRRVTELRGGAKAPDGGEDIARIEERLYDLIGTGARELQRALEGVRA